MGCSIVNHPFLGIPHLWKPQYSQYTIICNDCEFCESTGCGCACTDCVWADDIPDPSTPTAVDASRLSSDFERPKVPPMHPLCPPLSGCGDKHMIGFSRCRCRRSHSVLIMSTQRCSGMSDKQRDIMDKEYNWPALVSLRKRSLQWPNHALPTPMYNVQVNHYNHK